MRRALPEAASAPVRLDTAGFTLIELMAVLLVIMVLAGISIGVANYANNKAATSRVKSEIAALEAGLEAYRLERGAYVAGDGSANSSAVLHQALAGSTKVYFTFRPGQLAVAGTVTNIVDAWGTAYRYKTGGINQAGFDLWSCGADRKSASTAEQRDDIGNWN
jgi:general secretion pathway protein G